MRVKKLETIRFVSFIVLTLSTLTARAADADDVASTNAPPTGHYGLFDLLDHRSAYTQEVFPEPFIVEDTALEDNELQLTWGHSKGRDRQMDTGTVELQKGIGLLTLEADLPYQDASHRGQTVRGFGPLGLGARYPLYQYVSPNRTVDLTFGPALEAAIPVQVRVDPNTELEPEVFNTLRLGNHFTMQTTFGYEALLGPGDNSGERSYNFGTSMGYQITHGDLALPGVVALYPIVELANELGLNKDERGKNNFEGAIGARVKFKTLGEVQPNVGFAYVEPLDSVAHSQFHWGFVLDMIFDF
jgi:hypothetical protein